MIKTEHLKGIVFAFVGTFAISNVYIFSKAALNEVGLATFWFYWFLLGVFWFSIYAFIRKEIKNVFSLTKNQYKQIGRVGLFELFGTSLFFIALNTIENPSLVSFLGNVSPVFVAILSFFFLRERFSWKELLGMAVTLSGIFAISYRPNTSFSDMFIDGTQYILLAALVGAVSTLFIKKGVAQVKPLFISLGRTVVLFIGASVLFAVQGFPFEISRTAFFNIAIGSFLGPFLAISANYMAMKHIQATQASIINSTKSFFVLIGAFVYFGKLPLTYQIIGGTLTVIGVILMVSAKKNVKIESKAKNKADGD